MEASGFVKASPAGAETNGKVEPADRKSRFPRISPLFMLTVFLPTLFAGVYYGLIASNVYISEASFVIRSPYQQPVSGLGGLLQGMGFSKAQDDAAAVGAFIISRDALRRLDDKLAYKKCCSRMSIDRLSRFGGFGWDTSFEALHKYYLGHVHITHDESSSITTLSVSAFSAQAACSIDEMLLDLSEQLVNKLNERSRQDMIRFAADEVDTAQAKAKIAAIALASYRGENRIFDPKAQSVLQLQVVSKLRGELIASKAQLAQLQGASSKNPAIPVLQNRIKALNSDIQSESAAVAGAGRSLSADSPRYEGLVLDNQFAQKQLASAMATLVRARDEAVRKQLYLERIVQPGKPDYAEEPQRLRNIVTTLVIGLLTWGALGLLIAGVREHRE